MLLTAGISSNGASCRHDQLFPLIPFRSRIPLVPTARCFLPPCGQWTFALGRAREGLRGMALEASGKPLSDETNDGAIGGATVRTRQSVRVVIVHDLPRVPSSGEVPPLASNPVSSEPPDSPGLAGIPLDCSFEYLERSNETQRTRMKARTRTISRHHAFPTSANQSRVPCVGDCISHQLAKAGLSTRFMCIVRGGAIGGEHASPGLHSKDSPFPGSTLGNGDLVQLPGTSWELPPGGQTPDPNRFFD